MNETQNMISLELKNQLRLTPQLMQSLKILQMTTLELNEYLDQMSLENPVMEREEDLASLDDLSRRFLWLSEGGSRIPRERILSPDEQPDLIGGLKDRHSGNREDLESFLKDQILTQKIPEPLHSVCLYLAGMTDPSGFLEEEDLAHLKQMGVPKKTLKEALKILQSLEPAGVGARSLSECLCLQLARLPGEHALAEEIARNHLPELEKKQLSTIARLTGKSREEVAEAVSLLGSLKARPGDGFDGGEETVYLYPDFLILEEEGKLKAVLCSDYTARLHLNPDYLQMLKSDPAPEVKQYLGEKFRQARWVMNCMERRKSTLERCMDQILEIQEDFFRGRARVPVPCQLGDMADKLGVSISTVSRAISGKYLQCRRGLFPLRDFFLRPAGSNDLTEIQIKSRLAELIRAEEKPLTDEQLRKALEREGICLARRTVAKYRSGLGIPPARERIQVRND
ncbi:MAG: RNA polymerase factor sigma-54 [Lachnospiraceae bacterium]|nr:RNA polymerase factor sigma-54 [Lachnospiraceae bacterium]